MRSRLFITWAAVRWLLLMFVVATSVQAPAVARINEPVAPLRAWVGVASWYGPRFHGRITASGEVYNMYAPTAAHPTLPLGSLVRVVNLKNGRSRVVRITDRGPIIPGREIDVSYQVACWLGFEEQ